MQTTNGMALGHHDHYVVDGGRARIVLAVLVTPAEVQDNQPALDLRWHVRPRQIMRETKYGTAEIVEAIEREGNHAYAPLPAAGRRPGLFADTDFAYDAANDVYRCPGGRDPALPAAVRDHAAPRLRGDPRGVPRLCAETSGHDIEPGPARRAEVGRGRPRPGARPPRDRGLRQGEAQAKGLGRAAVRRGEGAAQAAPLPPRGLVEANIQAQLIAAGQNLERLPSRRGRGRRPWPSGAAGVVLPAVQPVPAAPW